MRALVLAAALAPAFSAPAAAEPPAPAGWSRIPAPGGAGYRAPDGATLVLAQPEQPADLDAWFGARTTQPPPGLTYRQPPNRSTSDQGVRIAVAQGEASGGRVVVVGMACLGRDGQAHFAQLVAPAAADRVEGYAQAAAEVVGRACLEAAPATPAARTASVAAPTARATLAPPRGGGLKASDIEAVIYTWREVYQISGLQMVERTYLLLKDGTYLSGLPKEAPEAFDVTGSQRARPGDWGRWRKSGGGFELQQGSSRWTRLDRAIVRLPGRPGERLNGRYVYSSHAQIPGGAGSWSQRFVVLRPDGRFSKSATGGVGGGAGFGDARVTAGGVWDDEGSSTSVAAANFGGGATRRFDNPQAGREGTYRVDGYTLELRYDDGRVERQFFYTTPDRRSIWFEGRDMFIPKN